MGSSKTTDDTTLAEGCFLECDAVYSYIPRYERKFLPLVFRVKGSRVILNLYQTKRCHTLDDERRHRTSNESYWFWNVTPCSLAGMYLRFKRNYRLHLRSTKRDMQDTLLTCTVLVTFQTSK